MKASRDIMQPDREQAKLNKLIEQTNSHILKDWHGRQAVMKIEKAAALRATAFSVLRREGRKALLIATHKCGNET